MASDPVPLSMSSQEVQLLTTIAHKMYLNMGVLVCLIGFYGIYFVINGAAYYSVTTRRSKSRSTWALIMCLSVVFIIITTKTAVGCSANFLVFRGILFSPDTPIMQRYKSTQAVNVKVVAANVVFSASAGNLGLVFIISDALTVWRAVAISNPHRYVGRILYLMLISTIAFWLPSVYYALHDLLHGVNPIVSAVADISAILEITGSTISIVVNIICTSMISLEAHRHRLLGHGNNFRFKGGKVLLFLAESGFVYAIIQVISLLLSVTPGPRQITGSLYIATSLWIETSMVLSAIYTPIIILIVTQKASLADTMQLSTISSAHMHDDTLTTHAISNIAFASFQRSHGTGGDDSMFLGVDSSTQRAGDSVMHSQDKDLEK